MILKVTFFYHPGLFLAITKKRTLDHSGLQYHFKDSTWSLHAVSFLHP